MIYMFTERSDEWLDFRKGKVSATEVASLLGLNSYLSMNQLYQQKHSTSRDKLDNPHLRDGRAAESLSFALLSEMGWKLNKLSPEGNVLVFTDEEFGLSSTPDSFRWDGEPAVVEVKKVSKSTRDENPLIYFEKNWSGGTPPPRYLAQVQMQMHTTGIKLGYLTCVVLEDNIPISIYKVNYSPSFIAMVKEALVRFRAATPGKKLIVKEAIRTQAMEALERSFEFIGVFRHNSSTDIDLTELFK